MAPASVAAGPLEDEWWAKTSLFVLVDVALIAAQPPPADQNQGNRSSEEQERVPDVSLLLPTQIVRRALGRLLWREA